MSAQFPNQNRLEPPPETLVLESTEGGGIAHFAMKGALTADTAHALDPVLSSPTQHSTIVLDCEELSSLDSAGVATLSVLARQCEASGKQLQLTGLKHELREIVALMPRQRAIQTGNHEGPGLMEQLGARLYTALQELAASVDMAYFLARAAVRTLKGEFPPRGSVSLHSLRIGVEALPIVTLLSLLLGLVLAFQAADQLKPFGADIYTANLVGIGMFREFGPVLTGVVVAGRSGSAMAAELGTMQVNEEVDALRVLGIEPHRYLVLPRFLAIVLMQPGLTLMGDLVGCLGGYAIGTLYLGLPGSAYFGQSIAAIAPGDVFQGLAKSVIFAGLTGLIGCYCGLTVRGGADAVGTATTRAVVASIFMLIIADSIFTTLTTLMS